LAESVFSIEHTEKLVALSKVDRGANEEELGELMNQIIHKQNTTRIRLKAA
jgi:hypothetical protein